MVSSQLFDFNKNPKNYNELYWMLYAVSSYEDVEYLQGMNFVVASLLFHCDEPKAFFLIIKLYQRLRIPSLYRNNLQGLLSLIQDYFESLRYKLPPVHENLTLKGINPEFFLLNWFVTLGTGVLPQQEHISFLTRLIES